MFNYRRLFWISEPDGLCKNGGKRSPAHSELSRLNSHPAASGQLDYIRIICSFLIFQQIKTYINSLEPEGEKIFLCFLSVTLNYCNTCYEFLISFNMSLVRRQNHLGMANKTVE